MVSRAKKSRAPKRGDIVWIKLSPTKGKEQRGHRPAIILSLQEYNKRTGLALMCPITSKIKNYPLEYLIQTETFSGVILTDQIRCIDWKRRITKVGGSVGIEVIMAIIKNILSITVHDLHHEV